jgi:hypothetical protein
MPTPIRISIQVLLFALLTVVLTACITIAPLRPRTPTATQAPSLTPLPTLVQATQPIPSSTLISTLVQAIQPEPVFTPVSTRVQGPGPERIHFEPDATSAMVRGRFTAPGRKEYILNATAGQVMEVGIDNRSGIVLDLKITSPDGMLWMGYDSWGIGPSVKTITLTKSGDYLITLTTPADAPAMDYEAGFVIITPAAPGASPERIDFVAGTTEVHRSGALIAGGVKNYLLNARAGQTMQVQTFAIGAPASFVVKSPGGSVYPGEPVGTEAWVFVLNTVWPESGDYLVTVSAPGDGNSTIYGITFSMEAGTLPPTPERVQFEPGASEAMRTGSLAQASIKQYLLHARAGQTMDVLTTGYNAPVGFSISSPTGTTWEAQPVGELGYWEYTRTVVLPESGDYLITLSLLPGAVAVTDYAVRFAAAALPVPPERVAFASGEPSSTRTGIIGAGVNVKEYILSAAQGQRLRVTVTTATSADDGPVGINVTLAGTNDVLGSSDDESQPYSLTVDIPATADYVVNLNTARAAGDTGYTVVFEIE